MIFFFFFQVVPEGYGFEEEGTAPEEEDEDSPLRIENQIFELHTNINPFETAMTMVYPYTLEHFNFYVLGKQHVVHNSIAICT